MILSQTESPIPATTLGLALTCLALLGLLIRWVIVSAQADSDRADKATTDHVASEEAARTRAEANEARAWATVAAIETEVKRERAEWAHQKAIFEALLRERDGRLDP